MEFLYVQEVLFTRISAVTTQLGFKRGAIYSYKRAFVSDSRRNLSQLLVDHYSKTNATERA